MGATGCPASNEAGRPAAPSRCGAVGWPALPSRGVRPSAATTRQGGRLLLRTAFNLNVAECLSIPKISPNLEGRKCSLSLLGSIWTYDFAIYPLGRSHIGHIGYGATDILIFLGGHSVRNKTVIFV